MGKPWFTSLQLGSKDQSFTHFKHRNRSWGKPSSRDKVAKSEDTWGFREKIQNYKILPNLVKFSKSQVSAFLLIPPSVSWLIPSSINWCSGFVLVGAKTFFLSHGNVSPNLLCMPKGKQIHPPSFRYTTDIRGMVLYCWVKDAHVDGAVNSEIHSGGVEGEPWMNELIRWSGKDII